MKLHELHPAEGSRHRLKRKGRGIGSGLGKTSGKGHKGQKARSGGGKGPYFEGGQTPLQRRLPKRGFSNYPFRVRYSVISLSDLTRFEAGSVVTPDALIDCGLVKQMENGGVKVLANGEIDRALTVKANAFSAKAKEAIEAAGGKAEVIE
ncbi:MAG: 50S ribosomal protein L15 [Clostridia bacterium]|uniref:Large ribosomal subunit protein uL15 n=1 Tax=Peptococcus niger TaxID=2741 RepID=A0A1G6TEN9_PEPNI|nr:50S ribosomal protein L15 [Peptococcus niger]MBS5594350.1 50S ribosomal protein L15 [Clostridiales bacterium]MDU7504863.1 50S ribosomal protein L15 [Clostridia bacterium]MBS5916433.1 50S ribosomal protein L15 [Clostridiales bacterium]MDU1028817.1 50S ribosomal protein L15 [Clostridiales bacterium]MDU2293415.1 50S ribosomal protein L15 [Peptococcus niger]